MNRDKAHLLDIARFAETILQLTSEMDEKQFRADLRTQLAISYELSVLGEAVKRLSLEFRQSHPEIPWRSMAGMRDKLIHDYDGVLVERIWEVASDHIPKLLDAIAPLLPRES